jgi:hypothetical protein
MSHIFIKVGSKYYNEDRTLVATVARLSSDTVHYYWERIDGKPLLNCYGFEVMLYEFKKYVRQKKLKELTSLEIELL